MNKAFFLFCICSVIYASCSSLVELKKEHLYGEWQCYKIEEIRNGKKNAISIAENDSSFYRFEKFNFAYLFEHYKIPYLNCTSFLGKEFYRHQTPSDSISPYTAQILDWRLQSDTLILTEIQANSLFSQKLLLSFFTFDEFKLTHWEGQIPTHYYYKKKKKSILEWKPKKISNTLKIKQNILPISSPSIAKVSYNFAVPKHHYARAYQKDSITHVLLSDMSHYFDVFLHFKINQAKQSFVIEMEEMVEGFVVYKEWESFSFHELSMQDSLYQIGDSIVLDFDCQFLEKRRAYIKGEWDYLPYDSLSYKPVVFWRKGKDYSVFVTKRPLRYKGKIKLPLLDFEDPEIKNKAVSWYDNSHFGAIVKVENGDVN